MKGQPLYERIYEEILNDIQSGKYDFGKRLPSEKELCAMYNVSRITGKKAMDMLAEQNKIIRIPGKGSFVNKEMIRYENTVSVFPAEARKTPVLIGVIMDGFGGSYGYKLLLGMEKECRKLGYILLLRCTNGDKDMETKALEEVLALGAQGIIIMCVHSENYNSMVLKLVIENYPIVLVDRCLKGIQVSFVGTDNQRAAYELTAWLLNRGYTNICFATHCGMDTPTIAERQSGFVECHLERGLISNESAWITDLRTTLPSFRNIETLRDDFEKIERFILEHPEVNAFFAVEYDIAQMIRQVVKKMGRENQYKIVCFDGYDSITEEESFTHIRQGEERIGQTAVDLLKKKFEGDSEVSSVLIPYEIIEESEGICFKHADRSLQKE